MGDKEILKKKEETEMLLYIIRHGETQYNAEKKMQGSVDIPLNDNGRFLAEETAKGLADVKFDLLIASDLSRAYETAQIVSGYADIPLIKDKRIREIDWGSWEGTAADGSEIEELRDQLHSFFNHPSAFTGSPDGEVYANVFRRVNEFMDELTGNPELADKTILIATHGVPSRAILNYVDPVDPDEFWRGAVPANCSVSICRIENGKMEIEELDHIYYDKKYLTDFYPMK